MFCDHISDKILAYSNQLDGHSITAKKEYDNYL